MSDAELDAIEQRAALAYRGPWTWEGLDGQTQATLDSPDGQVLCQDLPDCMDHPTLTFIAHAREDVPALIAEIRRMHDMLRTAQERAQSLGMPGRPLDPLRQAVRRP